MGITKIAAARISQLAKPTANRKARAKRKHAAQSRRVPIPRLVLIYAGLVVFTAIAAGVIAQAQPVPLPDPFRAEQRTAVSFMLYYPAKLPEPYYVDMASLGRTQTDVVAMRLADGGRDKSRSMIISQQTVPVNFNFDTFHSSFAGKSTFHTNLGTATTGTIDNGKTQLVSLVTPDHTWILLQAPSGTATNDFILIFKNLRASQ